LAVSGTLGETLAVHASSSNFRDVLPLFPLFGASAPTELRASLHGGRAQFDGMVTGPLANPRISGRADVTHLAFDQREFDHIVTTLDIDKSTANLRTLAVDQGKMHVEGQARIGLVDWKPEDSSALSASVSVRGADIQKLLVENGYQLPVTGALSATVRVTELSSPRWSVETWMRKTWLPTTNISTAFAPMSP